MDLVTLVTACALGVEPKLMHALVWHQSGGDPWSFSVPGESDRRTYATLRDAIREVRTLRPHPGPIRVGLAGVPIDPSSVAAASFIPCVNVTIAARQIVQLTKRCSKLADSKADLPFCAIAAYHGSWERPDTAFAQAVTTSVAKGDVPDFDMPNDGDSGASDLALDVSSASALTVPSASAMAVDDTVRGWSSALFPAKPVHSAGMSNSARSDRPNTDETHSPGGASTRPVMANPTSDGPYVTRSVEPDQ